MFLQGYVVKAKVARGFRWIEIAKRPRAVLGLPEARQQRCSPNPRCPGESPCTADPKSWLGASDNIRDIVTDPNMDPKSLSKLIRQYLYDPRKKQGSPKTTLQILRGILASACFFGSGFRGLASRSSGFAFRGFFLKCNGFFLRSRLPHKRGLHYGMLPWSNKAHRSKKEYQLALQHWKHNIAL